MSDEPRMGMAATPDQMNRMRSVLQTKPTQVEEKKKKGKGQRPFVRVTVDSPSLRSEINQIIYGVHWQYQKQILNILRIVTDNEKWDTTRTIVMDIQTEQIETMRALVGRRITDHLMQENKETENGHESRS